MDIFSSSIGQYKIVDNNHIQFIPQKVMINDYIKPGLNNSIELVLNQSMGIYLIEPTPKGYRLIFDRDNKDNQQLIKYSTLLDNYLIIQETTPLNDKLEWTFLYSKDEDYKLIGVSDLNLVVEKASSLVDSFDIAKINVLLVKKAKRGLVLGILIDYEGDMYIINYVQLPDFRPKENKVSLIEGFVIQKI